jgi:RNA polymerase sigma factor (sigma-70 family)
MAKEQSIPEVSTRTPRQRQITPESFAGLLAALGDARQEQGIHYEQLRSKLILFFSRRMVQLPEDLADEVLDRLAHRIAEGTEIASLPAFALGIARHVAQEQGAGKNPLQKVDDSFWDNVPAPLPTQSNEEEITRMERCLKKLAPSEAKLLRGYYLAAGNNPMQVRKSLAERLGISTNTLRQRVFLARQSLRACMMAAQQKKRK